MKVIVYIAVLIGLAGASVWIYTNNAEQEKMMRAQEYQRMLAEAEQAKKESDERERQKQREEEAKDKAVKMLQAYIGREEARLKKIIEEAKIDAERTQLDLQDMSDAMTEIEKENEKLAEASRKKGIKRFDKAERVSLILKNAVMNALAAKYTGEDLTATYAKYKAQMNVMIKIYRDATTALKANREEYYKSIAGADETLDKLNQRARHQNNALIRRAEQEIYALEKEKAPLVKELSFMMKQAALMRSPMHEKKINELKDRIAKLDERLEPARTQLATIMAQAAHMDATEGETSVRRKQNRAQDIRAEKDNDVHKESEHEAHMHLVADRYENETLDKIRAAIRTAHLMSRTVASDAQSKIDYLERTATNIDLLRPEDIEVIREKIAAKLSDSVVSEKDDGN